MFKSILGRLFWTYAIILMLVLRRLRLGRYICKSFCNKHSYE